MVIKHPEKRCIQISAQTIELMKAQRGEIHGV